MYFGTGLSHHARSTTKRPGPSKCKESESSLPQSKQSNLVHTYIEQSAKLYYSLHKRKHELSQKDKMNKEKLKTKKRNYKEDYIKNALLLLIQTGASFRSCYLVVKGGKSKLRSPAVSP